MRYRGRERAPPEETWTILEPYYLLYLTVSEGGGHKGRGSRLQTKENTLDI